MGNAFSPDWGALPEELKAMLACMRPHSGNPDERIRESLRDIDWNQFAELAMHHRVYPQLYAQAEIRELIPADVRQALEQAYRRNVLQMLALSAEMESVCRALAERGVRPLVLKGPVLAKALYGDLSLRTSKDLDILIPIEDVEKAEETVAALGYAVDHKVPRVFKDWKWKVHHMSFVHPRKRIQVEIHWRLNANMGKEPSFDELWERRGTSPAAGRPVHMLGSEHLFLYLVSHGARHGWFRLRWLADIDRLARTRLNGAELAALLRRYGCLHLGGQALLLASRLLGTPVTDGMKPLLADRRARRLAQRSLRFIRTPVSLSTEPGSPELAQDYKRYLFELKTNREKLIHLARMLYPSFRDAEALPLPRRWHFLYFPLRPFIWLWRHMKA